MPIPYWLASLPSMMAMFAYRTSRSIPSRSFSSDTPRAEATCFKGTPPIRTPDQTKTSEVPCSAFLSRSRNDGSLPCARRCPEVDPTFGGVPVDVFQLFGRKLELIECADVLLQLCHAAGPDERRRDAWIAQSPGERHLRQRLAAPDGDLIEGPYLREELLGQQIGGKRTGMAGSRAGWDTSEVSVGEQALREWREHDAADPLVAQDLEEVRLDPPVQHRVGRLVDEERRSQLAEDGRRIFGPPGRVRGDAGVERLALADGGVQRTQGLLERGLGIEAMRIEDVNVLEAQPLQAPVEAGKQVLPRTPEAVRPGPHVVTGLGRDHQLVAVSGQVGSEDVAEALLGRAVRRPIVVRQVEVRDAEIEGAADDGPLRLDRALAPEVLPEPKGHGGQLEPAATGASVWHAGVTVLVRRDHSRPTFFRPVLRIPHVE